VKFPFTAGILLLSPISLANQTCFVHQWCDEIQLPVIESTIEQLLAELREVNIERTPPSTTAGILERYINVLPQNLVSMADTAISLFNMQPTQQTYRIHLAYVIRTLENAQPQQASY
jgi:hypothetical protein